MKKTFKSILLYTTYLVIMPVINIFFDPIVKLKLRGKNMKVPLSHRLPFYLFLSDMYSQNVGRIGEIVKRKYKRMSAIEVGANVGDTITVLRNYAKYPVLAVEGDRNFFNLLKINWKKSENVYCENYFLGEKETRKKLRFRNRYGTGALIKGEKEFSIFTLDSILQKNKLFENSKYLITDTDGFDFKIIKGGTNFISRVKPIIYFEFDPDLILKNRQDPQELFNFLKKMEYLYYIIYDNMGDLIYSFDVKKDKGYFRLLRYLYKKDVGYYADVVAFHKSERDLFLKTLLLEDAFYNNKKNYK